MPKALFILSLSALAFLPFSDQELDSCKDTVFVEGRADGCVSAFPGNYPGDLPNKSVEAGAPPPQ